MSGAIERTEPPSAIETPCTLVCTLDTVTGLCFGCGRTGAEIAAWSRLTPEARRKIMAELPQRLTRLDI